MALIGSNNRDLENSNSDFVPLSGTEIGKSITGTLLSTVDGYILAAKNIIYIGANNDEDYSDNGTDATISLVSVQNGPSKSNFFNANCSNADGSVASSIAMETRTNVATKIRLRLATPTVEKEISFDVDTTNSNKNTVLISDSDSLARGLVGNMNFSPNITDLNYVQKIYVDTADALKQNLVTLTTTGTSGAATFNQATGALNIPSYAGNANVPLGIYQDPGDTFGLYITSPGFQTFNGAYLQNATTTRAGLMTSPDYIKLLSLAYFPTVNVVNVTITGNFSGLVIDGTGTPARYVIKSNAVVYNNIQLQFNNGFEGAKAEIYWQANFLDVQYINQEVLGGKTTVLVGDYQKFIYKDGKWWDSILFANTELRGTSTLVGGTVTVSSSRISINDRLFLTMNTPSGTVGFISAPSSSIIAQTSFVINSTSSGDTSTINWQIIK